MFQMNVGDYRYIVTIHDELASAHVPIAAASILSIAVAAAKTWYESVERGEVHAVASVWGVGSAAPWYGPDDYRASAAARYVCGCGHAKRPDRHVCTWCDAL